MKHLFFLLAALLFTSLTFSQNTAPVAVNDTLEVLNQEIISIDLIENDFDADGDSVFINYHWSEYHYVSNYDTDWTDSNLIFEPHNISGEFILQYTLIDNGNPPLESDFAFVIIHVIENPDIPVAVNDYASTFRQDELEINLLSNDFDPNGDSLKIYKKQKFNHSHVDILSDSIILYEPDEDFTGLDSVKYQVIEKNTSGEYYSYWATVYIEVNENENIPIAENDTITVLSQQKFEFNPLVNDHDPNGDVFMLDDVDDTSNGNAEILSDSSILYYSDWEYTGEDYVEYIIREKETEEEYISHRATVYIDVEENSGLPVAVSDTVAVLALVPTEINLLSNDYDPDGDSFMLDSTYHYGFIIISDSVIRYTSGHNTGLIKKQYRLIEKNTPEEYLSKRDTIFITVEENPDIPVAVDDIASGLALSQIDIDVLANDYDQQDDEIEINRAGGGDLLQYTSTLNGNYEEVIPYSVREKSDTAIYSESAKVTISLTANPNYPYCVDDYYTMTAGDTIEIDIKVNDNWHPGDTTSYYYLPLYQSNEEIFLTPETGVFRLFAKPYFWGIDTLKCGLFNSDTKDLFSKSNIILNVLPSTEFAELDINNLMAPANPNGFLFNNSRYEIPLEIVNCNGASAIFSNLLWLGGIDENDLIHLGGMHYAYDKSDFWPGPVSNYYSYAEENNWHRLWKINKNDIVYHIMHYEDEDYVPIDVIASWPGNGDPELGQLQQIAPYYDQNENGIYEPLEGDYPLIRGDQAIFFVYNDDKEPHKASNGLKLGTEIHGMLYAFDRPEDSVLFNTIFIHYDVYNRSENTYSNTFLANWCDINLGDYENDYFLTDVQRGAIIAHNAPDSIINGDDGELENASISCIVLNGAYMDTDGLDNPDGECNESINGSNFGNGIVDDEKYGLTRSLIYNQSSGGAAIIFPQNYLEMYNGFMGYWNDGTSILYGGNGYAEFGAEGPDCKFMFPGDSDPCNWGTNGEWPYGGYNQNDLFWTEEEVENRFGSKGSVAVSGSFTFYPDDVQTMDVAYLFAKEYGNGDVIGLAKERIDSLLNKVLTEDLLELDVLAVNEPAAADKELIIFPNPVRGNLINVVFDTEKDVKYIISDIKGTKIKTGMLNSGKLHHIGIENLSKGVYFISVIGDKKIYYSKFIRI